VFEILQEKLSGSIDGDLPRKDMPTLDLQPGLLAAKLAPVEVDLDEARLARKQGEGAVPMEDRQHPEL
jgi:hypothetical protein